MLWQELYNNIQTDKKQQSKICYFKLLKEFRFINHLKA